MDAVLSFDYDVRRRLERARDLATTALLGERGPNGAWTGELSSSALSTATAITALSLFARGDPAGANRWHELIRRGAAWLVRHQNADGGWGDTIRSFSNISTTMLVWSALGLRRDDDPAVATSLAAADTWLTRAAGSLDPERLVTAIEHRYGSDRTFSIPILTMGALCGRLGAGRDAWRHVQPLPFELAALPQSWFGALQLPVVSYALPALIAIGQVRHGLGPAGNPVLHRLRNLCRGRTLAKLRQLQPDGGGFLEATPLTSFVTMSLAALGQYDDPVVQRGVAFIAASIRPDGSWPIDTNLATWVTTLAVNAITPAGTTCPLADADRHALRAWLMGQQFRQVHPYTLAAPGGWAWTDLPGGVPDADDTPGAILALHRLAPDDPTVRAPIEAGVRWLLDLQNRDGGIPTFCRGWGRLPFDRSSPDITAHAIRAWAEARNNLSLSVASRVDSALRRAVSFLQRSQRADGAWVPLWFGHQEDPADENPLYGTARVLPALREVEASTGVSSAPCPEVSASLDRAQDWLVARQNPDGGWSGAPGAASSLEETALALEALTHAWTRPHLAPPERTALQRAITHGGAWLCDTIEHGRWQTPAPIGFYFAKLWYFERLYPLIFATGALHRLARLR